MAVNRTFICKTFKIHSLHFTERSVLTQPSFYYVLYRSADGPWTWLIEFSHYVLAPSVSLCGYDYVII